MSTVAGGRIVLLQVVEVVNVMALPVPPGRYRHYKGKDYQVLGCARHTETEEEFVVYRALYGDQGLWIRPKAMFSETVTVGSRVLPRFALLEPDKP